MPVEFGVWRTDGAHTTRLQAGKMDQEDRLEEILFKDIAIAAPNWMVIGRQVPTDYGTFIDLLAMDRDGELIVLELKKDKTPREVVAQLLDYGSWVRNLKDEHIASIYESYLKKFYSGSPATSLDSAFCTRFQVSQMPDVLNESHQLVVVASALDPSTERIVTYLADVHGVPINGIFFRIYQDVDREFLARAWLMEPMVAEAKVDAAAGNEPWNGEYYVSFGHGRRRHWDDATKYGFISGGGGSWYSGTLRLLEPGARVWVNVPATGYVGVGYVTSSAVAVGEFVVRQPDGTERPITELAQKAPDMYKDMDDPELCEYLVGVKWVKSVALDKAIREKGFFGNQNTVCKPMTKKWSHTVERLKARLSLS